MAKSNSKGSHQIIASDLQNYLSDRVRYAVGPGKGQRRRSTSLRNTQVLTTQLQKEARLVRALLAGQHRVARQELLDGARGLARAVIVFDQGETHEAFP